MSQIVVAVGTKNPCKIDAVKMAFEATFQGTNVDIIISNHDVESGVADQPFGDEETKLGAKNRAKSAFNMAISAGDKPDFGVGLEGGIEITENQSGAKELWCMAFMAVVGTGSERCVSCKHMDSIFQQHSTAEVWGLSKTASFQLPQEISRLVLEENMELGHADDKLFKRVNGKQGDGTVGKLTKGMISRAVYYDHSIKLALTPWIWPEHYITA